MPFINVKMLTGRTQEQNRKLVAAITEALVNIWDPKANGTMIIIEDVDRENLARGGILVSDRDK